MCNLSIFLLEFPFLFFVTFVYPWYYILFCFIVYLLYFGFFIFCLIYCFETSNILEEYLTGLYLILNYECKFIFISLIISGAPSIFIKCFFWKICSYITFSRILILTRSCKYLTHLFHWIRCKIIIFIFTITYFHVLFKTITR